MKKLALLLLTISWLLQPNLLVLAQENDPVTQCTSGVELFFAGDDNAAFPLLEAGFSSREAASFADPNDLGVCALALGLLRNNSGDRNGALIAFTVSLNIFQQTSLQQLESSTLNNIAGIHNEQGRYETALASFEKALAIDREIGDRANEGRILNNIALVYQYQGRYQEALDTYEKALVIRREVGDRVGEGITLANIAAVYRSQGQYEVALSIFEAALAILREVGDRTIEGTILNNIAGVYNSQGRFEAALSTYKEALTTLREAGSRAGEGGSLNNIAVIYKAQGRYEEALVTFEEALVILRKVGDRASEGSTLNNIALVYQYQGRYQVALTTHQEALAIRHEIGDRDGEGTTLNNIAGVYVAQGRYVKALTTYEEALAIRHEIGDRASEGTTLNNMGVVYGAQENYEEALAFYQLAIDIFETIRPTAGNDEARASFIAQHSDLYHGALELYVQEKQLEAAFLVGEQGRARSFGDALSTGSVQLSDNEAAPLIAAELASYNKIIAAQDALSRARALNPPDLELVADLEIQLENAKTTHDEALAAIAARSDQLAALVPGRRAVLSVTEVQDFLDEQSTLVSFWVLEEHTIAFILTRDSFEVVPIYEADEETLNTQVKAFHDFSDDESAYPDAATALYDTLIAPIHSHFNTPHLIIVPHQVLNYLPFAALTDGERYLMDDFAITYLPNASMLKFLPDSDAQPSYDNALILGNPAATAADEFDVTLANLPNAEWSAQSIANLFNTTPLLDEAATETAVRDNINTANILHLGAHGRYNTVAPMQSAIYLAPGEDEGDVGNNGRLRVDEVYGLPMDNIELVVLSACETNLGYLDRTNPLNNISAGDEIVSLNRAFLFQSPTVISTLWTVDDAATGLLMEQFYTYLINGKSKADALRLAQQDVRHEYPNPYFWAGFILSGDGGNVDISLLLEPEVIPEATNVLEATIVPEIVVDEETAIPSPTAQPTVQTGPTPNPSPIIWLIPLALLVLLVGGFVLRQWRK